MRVSLKDVWTLKLLIFISLFAVIFEAPSANATTLCPPVEERPCTALVLGGGGARGGAHIAVLRELERQQIPIDLIVGTSIGAFVGGMYAQGRSPDEIEQIMLTLDWELGTRDKVARQQLPPAQRQLRDQFPLQPDLGVNSQGFRLPKGVLHGQSMGVLIEHAYGLVPEMHSFDQLPLPFRAVATDIATGEAVVLDKGNLLLAVQASMSIPGVVRPQEYAGRLLVDGGVANNVPVSIAKALGATRVIAVAIDAPLLAKTELQDAVAVTEQLTNLLVRQGVQAQLALLTNEDVLIRPELATMGTLEFERLADAIVAGERAARQQQPALSKFSSPEAFAAQTAKRQQAQLADVQLAGIQLQNSTSLADDLLLHRLQLGPTQSVSQLQLQQSIERLYGIEWLERVSSTLKPQGSGHLLQLTAREKSWGPGYLSFRLQLQDDFQNQHRYQLATSYVRTGLSEYGAWWQSELALGTDKRLATQLHWPLGLSDWSWESGVSRVRQVLGLESSTGLSAGELSNRETALRSGLSFAPAAAWSLQVQGVRRIGEFQLTDALAQQLGYPRFDYTRQGIEWSVRYDSLDQPDYASQGQQWQLTWQQLQDSSQGLKGESDTSTWQYRGAWSHGANRLHARLRWQHYQADPQLPTLEQFALGGLLNLSGYPQNFLFGSDVRFGSLVYMRQFSDSRFSLMKTPLYLGASVERGRVIEPRLSTLQGASDSDWLWAGSLFLSWDSPIGPLYFGIGQAESDLLANPRRMYLSLGQLF